MVSIHSYRNPKTPFKINTDNKIEVHMQKKNTQQWHTQEKLESDCACIAERAGA